MNSSKEWIKKCKSTEKAINEISIQARKLGMSYGQYQAFLFIQENSKAKATSTQNG